MFGVSANWREEKAIFTISCKKSRPPMKCPPFKKLFSEKKSSVNQRWRLILVSANWREYCNKNILSSICWTFFLNFLFSNILVENERLYEISYNNKLNASLHRNYMLHSNWLFKRLIYFQFISLFVALLL